MFQTTGQCVSAIVISGLCAATGFAQLNGVGASTAFDISNGSLPYPPAVYQNGVIGASTYSTTTTGDFTVVQPYPMNTGYWREHATGFDAFRVGPVPVEISNVRFGGNYKLVNEGGELTGNGAVTSRLSVALSIRQRVGQTFDNQNDPYITFDTVSRAPLAGNGFLIDTFSVNSSRAPFVLTPGLFYYFKFEAVVESYGSAGYIGPQVGTTLEFGGPLSAGTFQGFTCAFDYRTVPTPSCTSLLAMAGGLATRRRRN